MKRSIFLCLAVFVLISLSCSFGTSKTAQGPVEVVNVATPASEPSTVAVPVVATQVSEPTSAPEVVLPAEATPTDAAPTAAIELATATTQPTATAEGPIVYTETFDKRNEYWSDPLVVTTQAGGAYLYNFKITVDGGVMRFAIQDKETYIYKFFLLTVDGSGSIEAVYEPRGAVNNSISVVCRANEDLTSWYEVRIISNYGEYNFYRYDKKRKTEENKNPYVLLGKGRMAVKEFSPGKSNSFKFSCAGDTLTLDMNKGKRIVEQTVDEQIEGNIVGIGVQSYDVLPVTMDFDTVTITQE